MARNPNRTHTLTADLTHYGTLLRVECHNDPDDPERDCCIRYGSGCAVQQFIDAGDESEVGLTLPPRTTFLRLPATAGVRWRSQGEYPELVVEA